VYRKGILQYTVKKVDYKFYVLLTVRLGTVFANNQIDAQFFFMYVYFYSLHFLGSHVPIIKRINCINTTSGICHSVQMTVWWFEWDWFGWVEVGVLIIPPQPGRTRIIQTCTPNSQLYRVIYTRCRIDTINSLDDGHMAARNMYKIEINIHDKELCVKLVIYKEGL
jgi:hypothetical protein